MSAGKLTAQDRSINGMNVSGGRLHRQFGMEWRNPSAALNSRRGHRIGGLWRDRDTQRFVDLSHLIVEGMTTYKGFPGRIFATFWTREESRHYDDGSSFQIGRIDMIANTGTYVDSPFHRYADGKDPVGIAVGIAGRPRWPGGPPSVRERLAIDGMPLPAPTSRKGGAGSHGWAVSGAPTPYQADILSSPQQRRGRLSRKGRDIRWDRQPTTSMTPVPAPGRA